MGGALEKSEKHAAAGNVAPAEPDLSTTQLPKADGLEVGTNDALNIVQAAEQEFTPDQYRRLLWKIDLVVLPLMWVSDAQLTWFLAAPVRMVGLTEWAL